ncbi:MAG: phosphatidic acid phosphatase, partial [Bacilli bacterium]|nr:phosphatidic acid phosphatase [Bacilli bacterium]
MKKLTNVVPKYAYFPLLMAIVVNTLVYNVSKLVTNHFVHYDFTMPIDDFIPVVPIFITIYVFCYIEWLVGYIMISRESKDYCFHYIAADIIAKLICLLCFCVVPTTYVRPKLGNGIFNNMIAFIYKIDGPVNLFPSIHCLESWMCFRSSIKMRKVNKLYKIFTFVYAIFVFLSVVFVKQHVFIDIIGGILVMELG